MLDYLRNLTKSDEEKRQEMLNAYLDDALTPKQRQQVEGDLVQDEDLTAELNQMRLLQQQMRQLPQRRVRRNFTLDPALFGRPQREPLIQLYPALRTATALAAFFFIFALAANVFLSGTGGVMSGAEPMAMPAQDHEEVIAEAAVEETVAESAPMEPEVMEEAVEEPLMAEEIVVESEISMPEDEAVSEPLLDTEIEMAAPRADAAPPEQSEAESPAEDNAMIVMPTMVADGAPGTEHALELQAAATMVAAEPAELPESKLSVVSDEGADAAASVRGTQAQGDNGLFLGNSLELIAVLLGVVFVVLIMLTLLARRRL